MVCGVFRHDYRLFGLYGQVVSTAREVRDGIHAVVSVYEIVFRGEGDYLRGVDGMGAKGHVVKVLHLVCGVIYLDVLVVVVVVVDALESPFAHVAHPIVPNVEHLLDDKVVYLTFCVGLLGGQFVSYAARE